MFLHTAVECPRDDLILHVVAQQLQRSSTGRRDAEWRTAVQHHELFSMQPYSFYKPEIFKEYFYDINLLNVKQNTSDWVMVNMDLSLWLSY